MRNISKKLVRFYCNLGLKFWLSHLEWCMETSWLYSLLRLIFSSSISHRSTFYCIETKPGWCVWGWKNWIGRMRLYVLSQGDSRMRPPPHVEQPTTKIGQQDMTKHNTQKISQQNNNNEINTTQSSQYFAQSQLNYLHLYSSQGLKLKMGFGISEGTFSVAQPWESNSEH